MRGSTWGKWDLHLHTPGTMKNDGYGDLSIGQFARMIDESGLVAVGITDYFSIQNAFLVKKELEKIGSTVKVFPNIELRDSYVPNKSRLNYHVLFSDELDQETIQNALGRIKIISGKTEPYIDSSLTKSQIDGAIARLEDVKRSLEESFKHCSPRPYIILSASGSDGYRARNKQSAMAVSEEENILRYVDAFFGTQRDLLFWCDSPEKQYPVFKGSDAHSQQGFLTAAENGAFTWIKGVVCFQTIWECIADPSSRIAIQRSCPDEKASGRVIRSITLSAKDSKNKLFDQTIELNPNLNTIIGARSSGKSILASVLAAAAGVSEVISQQQNTSLTSDPISFGPASGWTWDEFKEQVDVTLTWDDDERTTLESEKNPIIYLPQGFLNRLSENPAKISSLLETASMRTDTGAKFKEACERFQHSSNMIEEAVKEIHGSYSSLRDAQEVSKGLGEIDDLKRDLKEYQARYDSLSGATLSEDDLELVKQARELRMKHDSWCFPEQDAFADSIEVYFKDPGRPRFSEAIEVSLGDMLDNSWQNALAFYKKEICSNYNVMRKKILSDRNAILVELKETEERIAERNIQASLNQQSAELEELTARIKEKQDQINILDSANAKRSKAIESIEKSLSLIIDARKDYLDFARELSISSVDSLAEGDLVTAKVEFGYRANFSELPVVQAVTSRTTSDKWEEYVKIYLAKNCNGLSCQDFLDYPEMRSLLFDLLSGKIELRKKSKSTIWDLFREVSLCLPSPSLYGTYENDRFGGVETSTMSAGKRALACLSLILSDNSKNGPIIIDQPEDDLDTRSITSEIVPFIRKARVKRQVILVTHNANIAVGCDSELIISANQHSEKHKNRNGLRYYYMCGAIEESSVIDRICDLLDGGKEAFKKRAARYSIS